MHIVVFTVGALLYGLFVPARRRGWVLLIASVIAIYALQPALTVRYLDFILPTLTLILVVLVWAVTQPPDSDPTTTRAVLLVIGALVIALSLTRYLAAEVRITPSRPPDVVFVALGLLAAGLIILALRQMGVRRVLLVSAIISLILVLFLLLKAAPFATQVSYLLRTQTGQDVTLASPVDLNWLGFSYVAFRLLHILLEARAKRLPQVDLRGHLTFALFFPAYTAGPIDRIEHFAKEDCDLPTAQILSSPRWVEGGTRIMIGIFKKFVIADSLALIALNTPLAHQANSTLDLWLLLYAYAFRLYFDFSGYSDIAIGIARLYGIELPENFDRPYLKQNLAAFWQSWHMTLSQWARTYVFSPLSRTLLRRKRKPSPFAIVLIAQLATMIAIGLWHGVAATFLIWAIWHALGLFAHKWWSDHTRRWYLGLAERPRVLRLWTLAGIVLTFHFVVLGWVWFALPDANNAASVLLRLFGMGY
jgi:alginate O-acetyltransferase complex protein AlgI